MKNIKDLNFGTTDANLYKSKDWEYLDKIFFLDETINQIQDTERYYLIGEKGDGKTAYANYLSHKNVNNFFCCRINISPTDYTYFIELKEQKKIILPDYTLLWKNIILYQLLKKIIENNDEILDIPILKQIFDSPLRKIQNVIKNFEVGKYGSGTNITETFLSEEKRAKLTIKIIEAEAKDIESSKHIETIYDNPQELFLNSFLTVLNSISFKKNFILFVDGLDLKPTQIGLESFLDCVRGLSYAVENLNIHDLKNHEGKVKIMLLIRPDIFAKLDLKNANLLARANSVILDWRCTFDEMPNSKIFKLVDGILNNQQNQKSAFGVAWNHYFNFKVFNRDAFQEISKHTFLRPRDFIQLLTILKEAGTNNFQRNFFTEDDFKKCRRDYSKYLLGEIKDQMKFYYNENDYSILIKLFQFFNGKTSFTYEVFCKDIYSKFSLYHSSNNINTPDFARTPEDLLQFLYTLNIICYQERTKTRRFIKWSYKEKNYSDLEPQVKYSTEYQIHDGLMKALNLGQAFI